MHEKEHTQISAYPRLDRKILPRFSHNSPS